MPTLQFSKRRTSVPNCPCGKSNKDGKFVPYEGFTECGYCHACGETFLPKNSEINTRATIPLSQNYNTYGTVGHFGTGEIISPFSEIHFDLFRGSLKGYANNRFIQYLQTIFEPPSVKQVVERYFIGSSNFWQGATVFWQVDEKGKIRTGKIIPYDSVTGKRFKEPNHVQWVHSVMNIPNFNLKQCLFGAHLLHEYPKHAIGLVESEKTAIIASVYLPDVLWLATGGKSNLNLPLLLPLKGRQVTLFPDTNAFTEWSTKIKELQKALPQTSFSVSDVLEGKDVTDDERKAGLDIADFLVRQKPKKPTTDIAPPSLGNTVSIPNEADNYQVLTEYLDTANLTVTEPVFYPFEHPIYATIRPKHPQKFDENGLIPKRQKELRKKGLYATDLRYFDFETLLKAFGLKDALAHAEHQTKIYQYEKYVLYPTYLEFVNALTQQNA